MGGGMVEKAGLEEVVVEVEEGDGSYGIRSWRDVDGGDGGGRGGCSGGRGSSDRVQIELLNNLLVHC